MSAGTWKGGYAYMVGELQTRIQVLNPPWQILRDFLYIRYIYGSQSTSQLILIMSEGKLNIGNNCWKKMILVQSAFLAFSSS